MILLNLNHQTNFPNEVDCLSSTYKDIFDLPQLKNELSVVYFDSQFHNKNIQECVKLLKEFEYSTDHKLFLPRLKK